MSSWLGVVSAAHVTRAQSLAVAQVNHGKRAGLVRMHVGDTLIYYSPVTQLGDREPLRAFTACGTILDEEIWQADEGDFKPFRRCVQYLECTPEPLADLRDQLQLTAQPNWGYQLRRGLIPLNDADAAIIRARLTA